MNHDVLQNADPEVAGLIADEETRQADTMRLIASENYASAAVMAATGFLYLAILTGFGMDIVARAVLSGST